MAGNVTTLKLKLNGSATVLLVMQMHDCFSFRKPFAKIVSTLAVSVGLLTLASCSSGTQATETDIAKPPTAGPAPATMWVAAWGASTEGANASSSNPGGSEQSFRFIMVPTTDGTQERVHLSNRLGSATVTVGSARLSVAVSAGPAVDPKRDAPLTFNGGTSVTIPAGQEIVSDPVNVTYNFGEHLAVSVYLKGNFSPLPHHTSEVNANFQNATGGGDATADTSGASMPKQMTDWLMVTGIDVLGSYQGTVVVYGSSSIDGHASNTVSTTGYPAASVADPKQDNDRPSDWLARQLIAAGYRMGVLNAGAAGDPAGEDGNTSIAGVDRMQHDVLQQANVKAAIIYFGGVDIRGDCKPATDVEVSIANMVQQAQAAGVRVILATLPPSEYCTTTPGLVPTSANPYLGDINPGPENPGSTQRRALNDWIRTTGSTLPGVVAIADFDKALADPAHPDFMLPLLNSGDNFHPNGAGYGVQSASIPLNKILGQ